MARRTWEALSEAYRRRLTNAGINEQMYSRGDSLEKARGHSKTPEHPNRVLRNPEKYQEYISKRRRTGGTGGWSHLRIAVFNKVTNELIPYMESRYIGEVRRPTFTWSYQSMFERLNKPRNPETGELWDKDIMREFLEMDINDFGAIDWRDPEWSFLWYH